MPQKKDLVATIEKFQQITNPHIFETISWVVIEYLQALEFHQVVKDNPQIPDSTTSRKKLLNLPLLVLTVPIKKRHHPIEATEYLTSVDPTTCNEKLQESKLHLDRLISWREIGYVLKR